MNKPTIKQIEQLQDEGFIFSIMPDGSLAEADRTKQLSLDERLKEIQSNASVKEPTPQLSGVKVRITGDGHPENTRIVTVEGGHDISKYCLGAQIVIKAGKGTEATLYLAAPTEDIIVDGKVKVWDEIRQGYIAAERARVAEELVFMAQNFDSIVQRAFEVAIKDIIDKRTRTVMDAEAKQKATPPPDTRTREDAPSGAGLTLIQK
jgi:hypothetical protein